LTGRSSKYRRLLDHLLEPCHRAARRADPLAGDDDFDLIAPLSRGG